MSASASHRVWQSPCPNCGAPVAFTSAASVSAVCSYCQSTLLREGDALRRIGSCAEVFEDHSPLQLGVRGQYQGRAFTLVGRLQYRYAGGTWNEWHALFDATDVPARPAWLSEDNGAYVLAFDEPAPPTVPALAELKPGEELPISGTAWSVASVTAVQLGAAQGELPRPPHLSGEFLVADLRHENGDVGTLDGSDPAHLQWSMGHSVALSELALTGLRDGESEQQIRSQALACPHCGSALEPTLRSTQSLTCGQCHAVVDISQGAGADLQHYMQSRPAEAREPLIPLGHTGTLTLGPEGSLAWQVVGYMERLDLSADADDDASQNRWSEYLLYHRTQGFTFLVQASEGWSWARPITGAPNLKGAAAIWQGRRYRQRWNYRAEVTWVLGEFYWRVQRQEQTDVTDYTGPAAWLLSREATAHEVTWSEGQKLPTEVVLKAFNIPESAAQAAVAESSPTSWSTRLWRWFLILLILVLVVALIRACGSDDCDPQRQTFGADSAEYRACQYRQSSNLHSRGTGGSYGGYSSSGGGHK